MRETTTPPEPRPTLEELRGVFPRSGSLEWIGLRERRRGPVRSVETAVAVADAGIEGDHRRLGRAGSKRQITLIQQEHLAAIAALCGLGRVAPEALRRNLVVAGVNLLALRDRTFRVGPVMLEGTGLCHPCSRMEHTLGPGGYNAVRGHGGITARIVEGGVLRLGDAVLAAV